MTRAQLEHVLRAAGAVTNCSELIVIGSQAILASLADPPDSLSVSQEADVYVVGREDLSVLIDGTIGELSPFHQTFGYYGHGVGPQTAILPSDWRDRLVELSNANTNGVKGLCLSPLDIAFSKLAAGRPKDLTYCREMLRSGILDKGQLLQLIGACNEADLRRHLEEQIQLISR